MNVNDTMFVEISTNSPSVTINGTDNLKPASVHNADDSVSVFLIPTSIIILLIGTALFVR